MLRRDLLKIAPLCLPFSFGRTHLPVEEYCLTHNADFHFVMVRSFLFQLIKLRGTYLQVAAWKPVNRLKLERCPTLQLGLPIEQLHARFMDAVELESNLSTLGMVGAKSVGQYIHGSYNCCYYFTDPLASVRVIPDPVKSKQCHDRAVAQLYDKDPKTIRRTLYRAEKEIEERAAEVEGRADHEGYMRGLDDGYGWGYKDGKSGRTKRSWPEK